MVYAIEDLLYMFSNHNKIGKLYNNTDINFNIFIFEFQRKVKLLEAKIYNAYKNCFFLISYQDFRPEVSTMGLIVLGKLCAQKIQKNSQQ